MIECMLTTIDNPFDPFDEFDSWWAFDLNAGYNSLSFLARITITSSEMSEADQRVANEMAIDEIVSENALGIWKKVTKEISTV